MISVFALTHENDTDYDTRVNDDMRSAKKCF